MRTIIGALLVTISLLALGCGSDPAVGPEGSSGIIPLKVGNRWIGRWSTFDPKNTGVVTSTRMDTTAVIAEEMIGGERWFRIDSMVLRTNRSDGAWVKIGDFEPWLAAKYPAAVGDTFNTRYLTDPFGGVDSSIYYMSVVSTSTSVTVPAGTYSCIEYRSNIDVHNGVALDYPEDRYYYAPGTGLVKSETIQRDLGNIEVPTGRWELVEAHVL